MTEKRETIRRDDGEGRQEERGYGRLETKGGNEEVQTCSKA